MKWLNIFADKALVLENSILKQRLEKLESQYGDPYMKGFSHGVELTFKFAPMMSDKLAHEIKSQAIEETLKRMNERH